MRLTGETVTVELKNGTVLQGTVTGQHAQPANQLPRTPPLAHALTHSLLSARLCLCGCGRRGRVDEHSSPSRACELGRWQRSADARLAVHPRQHSALLPAARLAQPRPAAAGAAQQGRQEAERARREGRGSGSGRRGQSQGSRRGSGRTRRRRPGRERRAGRRRRQRSWQRQRGQGRWRWRRRPRPNSLRVIVFSAWFVRLRCLRGSCACA